MDGKGTLTHTQLCRLSLRTSFGWYFFILSLFLSHPLLTDDATRAAAIAALTKWLSLLCRSGLSPSRTLSRRDILIYAHLLALFTPERPHQH